MFKIFGLLIICCHSIQSLSGESNEKTLRTLFSDENYLLDKYDAIGRECVKNGDAECTAQNSFYDAYTLKHIERLQVSIKIANEHMTKEKEREQNEWNTEYLTVLESTINHTKDDIARSLGYWCPVFKGCKVDDENFKLCEPLMKMSSVCDVCSEKTASECFDTLEELVEDEFVDVEFIDDSRAEWPADLKRLQSEEDIAFHNFKKIRLECLYKGDHECKHLGKAYDTVVLKHLEKLKAHTQYMGVLEKKRNDFLKTVSGGAYKKIASEALEELKETRNKVADLKKNSAKTLNEWCPRYTTCKWESNDPELCRSLAQMATYCPSKS